MQDNDSRRRAYIIIFIVLSLAFLYIANNAKSNHSLDNEDSLYTFDSDIDVVSDNDNTEIEVMEISDNDSIENEYDDESDTGIIVQYGKRTSNETSSQDTNSKKNENAENGSEKIDDEALKEQEKIDEEAFVSSVEDTIEGIIGGKKDSESEAADNVTFRNDKLLKDHYAKHGKEMGFASKEEYEAAAVKVINNENSLHKTEKEDGDEVYYLEETNEFVIVSTDGYIRTYFYPDDGIDYFNRQ